MKSIKKIPSLTLLTFLIFFYSCDLKDFLTKSPAGISFGLKWNGKDITLNKNLELKTKNNEVISINDVSLVISDITLRNSKNSFLIKDYKLISFNKNSSNSYIDLGKIANDNYKISFVFGLKDIKGNYPDLDAKEFKISNSKGNGYYFLKANGKHKVGNDFIDYKYHIAKLNTNTTSYFEVTIDNFDVGKGLFANDAEISIDLFRLFSNPNLITIKKLSSDIIYNPDEQNKMLENSKNIFSLNRVSYD